MSENKINIGECLHKEFEILSKACVSPFCLVYDPLKSGSIDKTDEEPHDKAICRAMLADYRPNGRIFGKPECTLFVARLNRKTTERTLKKEFSEFGVVKGCTIIRNVVTGASQRYGFIEYENENGALLAYRRGARLNIDGVEVLVDFECERLLPGWVPRRLGGGFGGRKESGQLRFGCRDRPFKKPIKMLTKKEMMSFK